MKVMNTNSKAGRFNRIKTHALLGLRCKCMLMREIVPMGSEY
jgi:hypothetical protein